MDLAELFELNPSIGNGTAVFRGTEVPVTFLFEQLAAGHRLDDVLRNFPEIGRERAAIALMIAASKLKDKFRASSSERLDHA